MTEKEAFLNMIRKATRNRYERSQFIDCWPDYSEFERNYFEEGETAISVSNADGEEAIFYFDDDGNLMFFD